MGSGEHIVGGNEIANVHTCTSLPTHPRTHARTISPIVSPLASAAQSTQRPVSSRFMISRPRVGPENVANPPSPSPLPPSDLLAPPPPPMTMRRGVWWLGTTRQFLLLLLLLLPLLLPLLLLLLLPSSSCPAATEAGSRARHSAAARLAGRLAPWADSV